MEEFKLINALNRFVIVEPFEKSTVLKAEEVSTVFKVVSFGELSDLTTVNGFLSVGDLIIITPNSCERCRMGHKEVYYVRDTEIVAKVERSS